MSTQTFSLSPIGYVRQQDDGFVLELEQKYVPALKELEGFSHVQVFWWCHLVDSDEHRNIVECDKPYKKAPEKVGIFATRSPVRPNPIAVTAVPIIKIDFEQGKIHIPFLDAENDSPILDLKPYYPFDRIKEVSVPEWCQHWPQWYEDSAAFDWAAEFVNAQ